MMNDTNETANKKRVRRDRREEILQEATKLFSTYGYRGTSLASVAEAVGLSEPGLLHYFPSKANLIQNVLDYRDKEALNHYAEMFTPENVDLAGVMNALDSLVSQNEKIPALVRLFTVLVGESIREDHPSHGFFVNRYTSARQQYVEAFNNISENVELNPDCDFEQLASLIMAVMDGLQIQWLLDPENINMVASFKMFSTIVADYLEINS